MEYLIVIAVVAIVFGLLFLIDKGFNKLFRSQAQHKSGRSVRLHKRYATIGLVMFTLGIVGLFTGLPGDLLLIIGGSAIALIGVGLIIYYMTFGVFYDEDSFILMTFGKKQKTYYYRDICTQQLFNSYGNIVIELHLSDGRSVHLHGNMEGTYPFMDAAFAGWLRQTGRRKEDCSFHDPDNSCWFPKAEE